MLSQSDVLVMRCAWHPKYRGYPWIYSISSLRGRNLVVSDGMCRSCARHWRDEFRAGHPFASVAPSLVPSWMPRLGVALALTTAVILAARPLDPATAGRTASPSFPDVTTTVAAGFPSASPVTGSDDYPLPTLTRRPIRTSVAAARPGDGRADVRRAVAVRRDARPAALVSPCPTELVSRRGITVAQRTDCMRVATATLAPRSPQPVVIAQAP